MRLGGPVLSAYQNPEEWLALVQAMGYTAVYFPVDSLAEPELIDEYAALARSNDLLIAETGAWSNPMSPDPVIARQAIEHCCRQLELADRVGACCCVNIAGSYAEQWDGPHEKNFTDEAFEQIVFVVRQIIDAVQPVRTWYTLELMPWMLPDSADTYLDLIKAVDRPAFAVHFDPVNIICSPRAYYSNRALIEDCLAKLGPYIKSCHAKDIRLESSLTTHLNETRPGSGNLDYRAYLSGLAALPRDVPLMMEHMDRQDDVLAAAAYIRQTASQAGISL